MDLTQLDIAKITEQYLTFLKRMHDLNFDIAGEFLFLAATLLYLKSEHPFQQDEKYRQKIQEFLQNEENNLGITTKEDLIERLQKLKIFQELGKKLWSKNKIGHEEFLRPKSEKRRILESVVAPTQIDQLIYSQVDILVRLGRKVDFYPKEKMSIKEKLSFLKEVLGDGDQEAMSFFKLLDDYETRYSAVENKVVTFISILELSRLKKVEIFQNEHLKDIYIKVIGSLKDLDLDMANGFEAENVEENENEDKDEEIGPVHFDNFESGKIKSIENFEGIRN
jgi:segregation and condensation protein A